MLKGFKGLALWEESTQKIDKRVFKAFCIKNVGEPYK